MAKPKNSKEAKAPKAGKGYRTKCPLCKKPVESSDVANDRYFPFCGRRCKMADLQKWFDGDYCLSREVLEDEIEISEE